MYKGEFAQGKEGFARLSVELERQANIYKGLGVSKDAIMRLLVPRPERLPNALEIPVVTLGTSIDLQRQVDFGGILTYSDVSAGYDVAGGITFENLHLIWMSDGTQNLGRSAEWVRNNLPKNARPSTLQDGIALALVYPIRKVLQSQAIMLPGTMIRPDRLPQLSIYNEEQELEIGNILISTAWQADHGSALSGS
jgi:hypothetical protein